jgi:sulfur relay (sulfurtransferase) DsrC/TusE family protein
MIYYIKTDENGYVIDATAIETHLADYTPRNLNQPLTAEHLAGYYRIVNDAFVLDEAKRAELMPSEEPQE